MLHLPPATIPQTLWSQTYVQAAYHFQEDFPPGTLEVIPTALLTIFTILNPPFFSLNSQSI